MPPDSPPGAATRPDASWAHFEHCGAIGVRGTGPSREAALEQSVLTLTTVVTPPSRVMLRHQPAVEIKGAPSAVCSWRPTHKADGWPRPRWMRETRSIEHAQRVLPHLQLKEIALVPGSREADVVSKGARMAGD